MSAFLAGTAVGTLPANAAYVAVGAAVLTGVTSGWWAELAIVTLVASVMCLAWRKRAHARCRTSDHVAREPRDPR